MRHPREGRAGIYLIPALGGAERRLADLVVMPWSWEVWNTGLAWTADNNSLIVSDQPVGEPPGLFLLSAESGEKRRLTFGPPEMPAGSWADWDPALSPDGRWLAFTRRVDESTGDLHLLRLGPDMTAQGSPERLTFENREAASATWLSGGREILFSQGSWLSERHVLRLLVSPGADVNARRQVAVGTDATNLAFSRSSQRLVFSRKLHDSNIYRFGLRGPGKAAGEPERVIASTRFDCCADYSPNGESIAFVSTRSGSEEIWVSGADGSSPRQLTSVGASVPRWSPDGSTILFHSRLKGSMEIYVIGAQGGSPRPLTDQPSRESEGRWSRDGRWIYFNSDRTGRTEVWKIPAGGGEATQITLNEGYDAFESPDGRWLYHARWNDRGLRPGWNDRGVELWKAPVAGGAETRVLEDLSQGFNYVPTSHGVYFLRAGPANSRSETALAYLDFTTGKIDLLLPKIRFGLGLAMSPDGRSLLYSQTDAYGADLILVENFR
jgi:Tol biopolymer transport system component